MTIYTVGADLNIPWYELEEINSVCYDIAIWCSRYNIPNGGVDYIDRTKTIIITNDSDKIAFKLKFGQHIISEQDD